VAIRLGAFRLGPRLGSGGTGTVYRAVHEPTGVHAAVKVVRIGPDNRPVRNNLDAEVRAVVALDHPNIVSIYDVGQVDALTAEFSNGTLVAGTPWYAMELADDGSMRQRLRTLDWPDLSKILAQLLDALAHSHARGVLHLDLKPDNVLFSTGRVAPKLSDFGMGVVGPLDPDEDFVRGTPDYMAPEQVRGRWDELGPWTDLYALGCMAWRCATGEAPFTRKTPTEVLEAHVFADLPRFEPRFDVPAGLERWIERLVNKDPDKRFRFAADAARALAEVDARATAPPFPEDWRVAERQAAAEVLAVTGLGLAAVREPPMVGRTRERSALWQVLRRAHDGQAAVVVVRGPAGTGKSRLARWLGTRAHELGLAVVGAGAGNRPPMLVAALRRLFPVEVRSPEAEGELGARLQARGLTATAARDAAALLVHGLDGPPPSGQDWSEAIRELLGAASDRPAVMILDDPKGGAASLEALLALLRSGCPPSVWIVVAGDDELDPAEEPLVAQLGARPEATVVEVGPLSRVASAALSRRLLAFDPAVSAQIAARGGGSPLAQVQLVHDLAQRRALEPGPDGFRLRPGSELAHLLDEDAGWTERLRQLQDDRRCGEILELAAVLGPVVDPSEWSAAADALGLQVPAGLLDELRDRKLIRSATPLSAGDRAPGPRWTFANPHLRDALTAQAEQAGRAHAMHRACGAVVDPSDAERKGLHLWYGGQVHEALPFLRRALDAARFGEVGRYGQLLGLAAEAAKAAGSRDLATPIEESRFHLALAMGRLDDAADAVKHLRGGADDAPSHGVAELATARLAHEQGEDPEPFLARAELFADGEPLLLADILALGTSAAWARGDDAQAAARARRVAELALPERTLELQAIRAMSALREGRMDLAFQLCAALSTAADERAPYSWWSAHASELAGDVALAAGDAARASELYRTARRRFRALGHADEVMAHLGLAASLFALGRQERAADALERVRNRVVLPRQRIRAQTLEAALRALRPSDPMFPRLWRATEDELQRGLARLDPILGAILRWAADQSPRPERAKSLRDAAQNR
jgi:eukaryotic-like serine/threonine-protein kinase